MSMDGLEILNLRRTVEKQNIILERILEEMIVFNKHLERMNGINGKEDV